MTKTRQWLEINALANKGTALILENCTRYPKITSTKVLALERLEKLVGPKAVIDIVPFTLDIEYLYTPYSYLGRDILGYAHYYAFRENYHEMDVQGQVRNALDFDLLAAKVEPYSEIDYSAFLCLNRQTISFESSQKEHDSYQAKRDELFAKDDFSPRVAITELADLAHSFKSRKDALIQLLGTLTGKTLILANLSGYAKKAEKAAHKAGFTDVVATSYQLGADGDFDNCIYLESPIVKSYFLLDAESKLSSDCNVFHLLGDTKVDQYLYGKLEDELSQINQFTKELYRAKRAKESKEAVFTKERTPSSSGSHQMGLF